MGSYIAKRVFTAIFLIFLISIISFVVIQLPPGDFASSYVRSTQLASMTEDRRQEMISALQNRYGLDQPVHKQYIKWISNIIVRGDFGHSFTYNRPAVNIIKERLPLTIVIGISTLILQFLIAIPVGIFSAVKQYTKFDYFFTFFSFLGVSIPQFLLALIVLVISFNVFGMSIGGLFSPEYREAAWSFAKFLDMAGHLAVPIIVLGISSTAGTIRVLRAAMLDELGKEYVKVAKAKGLKPRAAIIKHATRISLNPIIAAVGWQLPTIISGSMVVSVVVQLPTTGPMLLTALRNQDMYLAGAFIFLLSTFTVLGTLVSDILLAIVDPRISFGNNAEAD